MNRIFNHERHEAHEGGFGGSSTLADKSFGLCSKHVFVPARKAFSLQAIACPKWLSHNYAARKSIKVVKLHSRTGISE
jgi:hypothetical protein